MYLYLLRQKTNKHSDIEIHSRTERQLAADSANSLPVQLLASSGNGVLHVLRTEQRAGTAGGPGAGGSISDGICGSAGAGQRLPPTPPHLVVINAPERGRDRDRGDRAESSIKSIGSAASTGLYPSTLVRLSAPPSSTPCYILFRCLPSSSSTLPQSKDKHETSLSLNTISGTPQLAEDYESQHLRKNKMRTPPTFKCGM